MGRHARHAAGSAAARGKPPTWRSWVARATLLTLGLAFALLLADVVLSVLDDEAAIERWYADGRILVPYSPGAEADLVTSEYRVRYRINRFGYRDRTDRQEKRAPGRSRVALLGDSFSEGFGVEQTDTFAALLEDRTGVEVLNFGVNGSSPLCYLFRARYVVEDFDPDLLLVQIFDNDLRESERIARVHAHLDVSGPVGPLPARLRPRRTPWADFSGAARARPLVRRLAQLRTILRGGRVGRSRFVTPGSRASEPVLAREEVITDWGIDLGLHGWTEIADSPRMPRGDLEFYDPARLPEWADRFALEERLLVQLAGESRAAGVPVAVIYIPVYLVFLTGMPPEGVVARNPHDQLLRAVCERASMTFLDGTEILGRHPRPVELYYPLDGHLNADGHAFLAEGLAVRLRTTPPFSSPGLRPGASGDVPSAD